MKKISLITVILTLIAVFASYGQSSEKLVSSKMHIKFFSTTPAEDIEAHNHTSVSTIDKQTGDVVFSVPMQGFEFEKSLMQKHYNSEDFLNTKIYPKAKLKGKITNIKEVNFESDGIYTAMVEGELTIKGRTRPFKEKGTVTVKGKKVEVHSTFDVILADYGITFLKGKPSTNIAKKVEVTIFTLYKPE